MAGYDKESETVTLEAMVLNSSGIIKLVAWLTQVQYAMRSAETKANGGIRWVFQRGHADAPMARRMHGKTQMADLELVKIRPRRDHRCGACGQTVEGGTMCWRQKPGQYTGHARARFCDRCVQDGGPPARPKLQLITGGA